MGHLLGANAVTLGAGRERIVFSGDLGRQHDLLLLPPERIARADVVLIEATYGNRLHPREDVQATLGDIIRRTVQRGGNVLLPAYLVRASSQAALEAALMNALKELGVSAAIGPRTSTDVTPGRGHARGALAGRRTLARLSQISVDNL